VPDLASTSFAWLALGADWRDPPAGSGRGPGQAGPRPSVRRQCRQQWRQGDGTARQLSRSGAQTLGRGADARVERGGDQRQAGGRVRGAGALLSGRVPGQLLYPAEPMYFIQTPKEVWMIWQRDHMVRASF